MAYPSMPIFPYVRAKEFIDPVFYRLQKYQIIHRRADRVRPRERLRGNAVRTSAPITGNKFEL